MEMIKNDSKLKTTLVFHLNKIGSLIIYILLPEELKNNPKQMRFLHKCESDKLIIKIKDINNKILIDYTYNFNDNSFSVLNIKNTLPKIISLSSPENNNIIKYLKINYSITKSTINDYFFASKILNYDTSYDYLEGIIEKKLNKNIKKIKIENIFCSNCNNNLLIPQKDIIYDYDSGRIEQNLEEFFNCQNNYTSFMSNNEATQGIENLKKTYEKKYNMDTSFLWIFHHNLETTKEHNDINNKKNIEFIYCDKCKEIIGKKEETNNILFNKLFLNLINFELNIDDNKENIVKINNFFSVDYLHVLLTDSIRKGKKCLIFLNIKNKLEIIFETKINILGLIDKNCDINTNINENILIDNYVNMFEINSGNGFEKNENNYDLNDIIILNDKDFNLLQNIIQENIDFYFSELFFYKLLTNESKKFYCLSLPKKQK
jgi:hypothetical protein